ncbi:hypothetical protein JKP88DRAFT_174711, partial [Tribonema minus]
LQHEPVQQVLATRGNGVTGLMAAAAHGHATCVTALLQHCPDEQVLAKGGTGMTVLMVAAHQGHTCFMRAQRCATAC